MQDEPNVAETVERRRLAAIAGHRGDAAAARTALADPAPSVRATALGALGRLGLLTADEIATALADPAPTVRRRACEEAPKVPGTAAAVLAALGDVDAAVVEVAAWALGEFSPPATEAVIRLAATATGHRDPLCREAAVAALGAIGDPGGLDAILAATRDKPAVRRRAVLALAPFEGPDVAAALEAALGDRDWQVRQAAEDLVRGGGDVPPNERP